MSALLDNPASGWWLAVPGLLMVLLLARTVWQRRWTRRRSRNPVRGLNYLLNEVPDRDLDAWASGLEGSDINLDAHLALATLLRRRGEIERAIRLHQGLLARPRLGVEGRSRVELELARDYLAAGLLNRAESLLRALIEHGQLRHTALEQLLEVHQRERDWHAAAAVARQLVDQDGPTALRTLAHHLCELADEAWQAGDLDGARRHLDEALEKDPACVRASLLIGRWELAAGHYRSAITALQRVREQDPRFLPEVLEPLATAHHELGSDRDLLRFLEATLERHPSATLAAELARHHVRAGEPDRARRLLTATLSRHPSLRGLELLLRHHLPLVDAETAAALQALEAFTARLVDSVDRYACEACGFSGPVLHWQCPGCKAWGTTAPRDGIFSA